MTAILVWILDAVEWIKKAVVWIVRNVWKFLAAFLGGLAVIFGISYIVQKRRRDKLLANEKFKTLKARVEAFESMGKVLEEENASDEAEVAKLEEEKEKLKVEIEEAKDVIGMTDKEILAEFRRLY